MVVESVLLLTINISVRKKVKVMILNTDFQGKLEKIINSFQ